MFLTFSCLCLIFFKKILLTLDSYPFLFIQAYLVILLHDTVSVIFSFAFFIKDCLDQGKTTSGVISAKQAEELRLKEKRRRENEVCSVLKVMFHWFVDGVFDLFY